VVLNANVTGSYQYTSLIFIAMIVAPWIICSKHGRRRIGLTKPTSFSAILLFILVGLALCAVTYLIFYLPYEKSIRNVFVYVSSTYTNVPEPMDNSARLTFFLIYAAIGMTFSPLGEEFLYRGIIHECFKADLGESKASMVDSAAFSVVHLSHFGIVYTATVGWQFLLTPSIMWMTLLFLTCLTFSMARRKTGSIFGSVLSHASFNIAMNYFIFYHVL